MRKVFKAIANMIKYRTATTKSYKNCLIVTNYIYWTRKLITENYLVMHVARSVKDVRILKLC